MSKNDKPYLVKRREREEAAEFTGSKSVERIAENVDEGATGADDMGKVSEETMSKAEQAITLRIQGTSWQNVCRLLNYSNTYAARKSVENYISQVHPSDEELSHQRYLHTRRLERLLNSVMPTAVKTSSPSHLAYNARALAILDRVAALQGLNAPQQQVVYTPRAEEIENYVAKFAVLAQQDTQAAEADVIEADVDEEE